MKLSETLAEYIEACFTGLWLQSHEHHEAIQELDRLCRDKSWQLATWNLAAGLYINPHGATHARHDDQATDPLAALRAFAAMDATAGTRILVLENFHRFLQSAEVVQHLQRAILSGKHSRSILIVLAPVVEIPIELQKLFVVIEHDLPTRVQLTVIAQELATEDGECPQDNELEALLDAASGLTRLEAENAFSLSLVRAGRLTAETLWQQKAQMLKKSGLLSLYRGGEDFSSLGGLANLKAFTRRALLQPSRGNPRKRPRGVLLLSPPGCGKSAFCKALGKEVGRPLLNLDVGSLMGSLVGQTEQRTREALKIIDAMAPCIVMLDEVEKAFAGAASGGQGDSGVSSRMFGTFLSWLNDHQTDVFVVCTANDVSRLPPEFGRAERFDGVFFVDLPSPQEKALIWDLYLREYELDARQKQPDDTGWTGAEIKACVRLAALLDVPLVQAAQNIVPVSITAAESIDRLRNWAVGRCLDASAPGIYGSSPGPKTRRKIQPAGRDPANN